MVRLSRGSTGSQNQKVVSIDAPTPTPASISTTALSSRTTGVSKKEKRLMKKASRPIVDKRVVGENQTPRLGGEEGGSSARSIIQQAVSKVQSERRKKKQQATNRKKRTRGMLGVDGAQTFKRLMRTNSASLKTNEKQQCIAQGIENVRDILSSSSYQEDPMGSLLKMIHSNMSEAVSATTRAPKTANTAR
eukprot:PhF_6_TR41158/c0_g1_i1/m.62317